MFTSENLPVLLKSVTLKQNDDRERFAYCKFVLEPFIPALARELGEEVAGHLFADEDTPRREVSDISFDLSFRLQRLIARTHPEVSPTATLDAVRIDDVRVTRPNAEKPRLRLEFVCVVPLIDRLAIEFVVYSFGNPLYLTFEAMQSTLPMEVREAFDNLAAGVDGKGLTGMSLSTVTDGKTEKMFEITPEDGAAARQRIASRKH